MLIVVIGILVFLTVGLLLLIQILALLLVSFFLLGLKVLLVGTIISYFLSWVLIDHIGSLLLRSRRLILRNIGSSYDFGLLRNICIIINRHSVRPVARFISSYLNFSSLFVGGPLANVLVSWLLNISVGPSNDSALSNRLLSNIVSILEISLSVDISRLIICRLVIESLISCGLILPNNCIRLFWLIALVVRIVLGVIVLNALYLVSLFLLSVSICLLSLIFGVINLTILVVSNCCFSWSSSLSAILLFIVALKIIGIIIDDIVLLTRLAWLLNTLLFHISHS